MPPLLHVVQQLIDRLYGRTPGAPDAGPFLIGDAGLRLLSRSREPVRQVHAARPSLALVLVRPHDADLRLAIYYPDDLIDRLERDNPCAALTDANIRPFLSFVEELDHFSLLATSFGLRRELSLLELELHANVTTYFIARHFLRRQHGRLLPDHEVWLDFHAFHAGEYDEDDPAVQARYADARRLAWRFTRQLLRQTARSRLAELRRWSCATPQGKVAHIERH